MPALTTPRWEIFAIASSKGQTEVEAYVAAGYKANEGNAGRLNRNEQVQARILELQTVVAEEAKFTLADMVRQVDEDRTFAREKDSPAAALAASMAKAKLLGLGNVTPAMAAANGPAAIDNNPPVAGGNIVQLRAEIAKRQLEAAGDLAGLD